jgi:hypothetical protein
MWVELEKLNLPRKKSRFIRQRESERVLKMRDEYQIEIEPIAVGRFKFIDESGKQHCDDPNVWASSTGRAGS